MKYGRTETHRGTEVGRRRKAGKDVAQDYFGKLKIKLINVPIETAQFVQKLEEQVQEDIEDGREFQRVIVEGRIDRSR